MTDDPTTIDAVKQLDTDQLREYHATRAERATWETREYGAFISVSDLSSDAVSGSLNGIPFAVKDNIDAAGLPTTAGTPALRESVAGVDAPVVRALKDQGALVAGKTNLHELAFGITSNNAAYGPVRNPHDISRSAGGSSGGSAVAVATGVVPFALGTDTGGSARIPAAHCGIVGFRPSRGRYPADGVVRLSDTRDTVGVLATSVQDVRHVDEVLTGAGRRTDSSAEPAINGLRIGVPVSGYVDGLDPEVASAFASALRAAEAAGAVLVDIDVSELIALDEQCGFPIVLFEAPRQLEAYLSLLTNEARSLTFSDLAATAASPDVAGVLNQMLEHPVGPEDYAAALRVRDDMVRVHRGVLGEHDVDVFAYPTVPLLPPPLGDDIETEVGGALVPVFATSIRNASPATLIGSPAISLPCGTSSGGLPIGISLEGLPGDDAALLDRASWLESAL